MTVRSFTTYAIIWFLLSGNQRTRVCITDDSLTDGFLKDTSCILVNDVDYDSHNWEYWGFENDWMLEAVKEMLKKKKVRACNSEEASSRSIVPGSIMHISFSDFKFEDPKTERYNERVTRRVVTSYTNTNPMKPVYGNVSATVYRERSWCYTTAYLTCRVVARSTDSTILHYRAPVNYYWQNNSATYQGDERALTANTIQTVAKGSSSPPPDKQRVQLLVKNSYDKLNEALRKKIKSLL